MADGSEQSSSSIVYSIECESIDSGINLINTYITKQISLSHCKAIVISEEYASLNISEIIYSLMNKVEISPTCLIIVSRSDAEEFLNQATSSIETASARYYDASVASSFATGMLEKTTLSDFFANIKDSFKEPIASLGTVYNNVTKTTDSNSTTRDSNYKAGDFKTSSSTKNSENLGLAVFKNSRLVGELNGIETVCHLIVTGKLQNYNLTIPDPFNTEDNIDLYITLRKSPKIKMNFVNGSPYFNINVDISSKILSMNNESGYLTSENINLLEETCNYYLEQQLYSYLYKTSKEFETDIDGFGKYAVSNFLTLNDWYTYDWLDNYKNSFFQVNVDSTISSGYLLMEM